MFFWKNINEHSCIEIKQIVVFNERISTLQKWRKFVQSVWCYWNAKKKTTKQTIINSEIAKNHDSNVVQSSIIKQHVIENFEHTHQCNNMINIEITKIVILNDKISTLQKRRKSIRDAWSYENANICNHQK